MYPVEVPEYAIDLTRPEADRWAEVIAHESEPARLLVREAAAEFERVPELLRWLFARLYQSFGGLYQDEIRAWAEGLDVSVGTATLLNCAYELSHLRLPQLFGCSTGVRWVDGLGPVHVRSLDWPLPSMTGATRLFRLQRGALQAVVVGMPGHVGALSGMVPHAYSATINWAPPGPRPTFDFGPAFLLRNVLETCADYDSAVRVLAETRLSTSVFFTLCGTEEGQACVIERTQTEAVVRNADGPALVQTNHHRAAKFRGLNKSLSDLDEGEGASFHHDSQQRCRTLEALLAELPLACTLDEAGAVLGTAPVLNECTCQQMAFCPRTGAVRLWRPERLPRAAG